MDVKTALRQRKSTRAFLQTDVPQQVIHHILEDAKYAPSGVNTQPWHVAVVKGTAKYHLTQQLEQAFLQGIKSEKDYQYYPKEFIGKYKERRKACGLALYSALQITKENKERQKQQWQANYRGFDAPVILLFYLDKIMGLGSYLDYGMFLQSVMLSAVEHGLATCPQAALAEYPDIVRDSLGLASHYHIICGMALGYEDTSHPVNQYRTEREKLENFVTYYH